MEMEQVIGLIEPLVKEGSDLTPIKEAIGTFNPMSAVKDKDSAWKFIKDNDILLSVLDQKTNSRISEAQKKWEAEALKDIESKVRAELAPNETPEQKQLRELKAKLEERDAKDALVSLQDSLSEKAKELDFDPMKARDYAVYGENAVAKLEADAEWFKNAVEEKVNSLAKDKYKTVPPKVSSAAGGLSALSDTELNDLAISRPELKETIIAEIRKRSRPK